MALRNATGASVDAVAQIERTIGEVNLIASSIAAAVEEQQAATAEIARNVSETARRLNMHRRTLQRILSRQARKKEVAFPKYEQLGSTSDQ